LASLLTSRNTSPNIGLNPNDSRIPKITAQTKLNPENCLSYLLQVNTASSTIVFFAFSSFFFMDTLKLRFIEHAMFNDNSGEFHGKVTFDMDEN